MSTVNFAEVISKLIIGGASPAQALEEAMSVVDEVVVLSQEQAEVAGTLIVQTRRYGLSLGDRACLALGLALKLPVYTADRAWKELDLGVEVHLIG